MEDTIFPIEDNFIVARQGVNKVCSREEIEGIWETLEAKTFSTPGSMKLPQECRESGIQKLCRSSHDAVHNS
jgi:hypothetical protein